MALLGQLIKSALDLGNTFTQESNPPQQRQEQQLRNLLQKAQHTSFGLYYSFSELLDASDIRKAYRETLPIFQYARMNERWWQQQQNVANVTWPGKPDYFALSSGTTGKKSKRIPVTSDMLQSFRKVGIGQTISLANFNLPKELFETEVLMLGSSANLQSHKNHLEGEISGINTSNLPPWFGNFYRPGLEIASIDNWDSRVEEIARQAPNWNIGAIAGIPSWVLKMLQTITEYHQLEHIHQIWPNLQLYLSGGVAFEPYRSSLNKLLAEPLTYLDTYLASEGFFAYTARPGSMDMRLAIDADIYYEFIPFDGQGFDETGKLLKNPTVLTIEGLEEKKDYALVISTPAGAWRYMIGDTVKFTNLEELELVISGRTKYFLNVVGSQLSEEKLNAAIQEIAQTTKLNISEYSVAALQNVDGEFYHQWVLGVEETNQPPEDLAQQLDQALK